MFGGTYYVERTENRSRLAGAVAKEGGVGVISTAQIGFEEPEFEKDQAKANLIAIKKHIKKAKELACGHGMVGVNIMVALKHYKEHVLAAVEAGADVIISGAGLPMELPELVDEKSYVKFSPLQYNLAVVIKSETEASTSAASFNSFPVRYALIRGYPATPSFPIPREKEL